MASRSLGHMAEMACETIMEWHIMATQRQTVNGGVAFVNGMMDRQAERNGGMASS